MALHPANATAIGMLMTTADATRPRARLRSFAGWLVICSKAGIASAKPDRRKCQRGGCLVTKPYEQLVPGYPAIRHWKL